MVRRDAVEKTQYFAGDASGGRYYQEVLEKLVRCGALGAFGWMFSDYVPVLWDRPPFNTHIHERFFGLTRYDGSVKPSGEVMHSFADQLATQGVPRRTVGPLKLDAGSWYRDPSHNFDRLFREWNGRI